MTFPIHTFGNSVDIEASLDGLTFRGPRGLSKREDWPADALKTAGAWRTSIEIEQLLELGFAEERDGAVLIPYGNFEAIQNEIPVSCVKAWSPPSPFLLKIDRKSDLGRTDFQYRYSIVLAGMQVRIDRLGHYVRRAIAPEVYLLDEQMYGLVEAMDAFNALPPHAKTPQESWLTFAKVKGCAKEVGATLDSTLQNNDVIVPSRLGLDMREEEDGGLTFLPTCAELATEEFHQVFERNPGAENVYSLDRPGLGRVRIVLTEEQHEVLRRMKRVRRVQGPLKETLKRNPVQAFDGVADQIDLPYGERVIGLGEFQFASTPRPNVQGSTMAGLWNAEASSNSATRQSDPNTGTSANGGSVEQASADVGAGSSESELPSIPVVGGSGAAPNAGLPEREDDPRQTTAAKKYLLIETNEDSVRTDFLSEAESAAHFSGAATFESPRALRVDRSLHAHQKAGVRWLQTCAQIPGRKGVLLADDMGVGKTIQILTFLAWCIESGKYPDLSKKEPPFRPILIVAPLILLDTQTWEREMKAFFVNDGVVFWPMLSLHGQMLVRLRLREAEGPEVEVGKPVLDLSEIQRHRVVITNYETLKNYQHSFAYLKDGKPLWSFVISDEAQEFKMPNTRISHAMKALESEFHIACTGTPVENRLLDLWNLCDVFQRGLLGSAKDFVETFEKHTREGNQEESLVGLKRKLLLQQEHAFLLRRTKLEVADLPPKRVVRLNCSLSDDEIAAHQNLVRSLKAEKPPSALSLLHEFSKLYQHPAMLALDGADVSAANLLSQSSKLRTLMETLHQIRGKREKVIIFARHRIMQTILAKVIEEEFHLPVRIINGETKMRAGSFKQSGAKTRDGILQEFRVKLGFNVIILSPFVAGIGLTITEANHVVHYGRWWNPAVESQATDRAYRIGQSKEVFVYLPVLHDPSGQIPQTFDERLDLLMERKQRLAEDFLRPLPPEAELAGELFADLTAEAFQGIRAIPY